MKPRKLYVVLAVISLLLTGCSRHRYLTPISTVKPDVDFQMTDESIEEAFQKKPQLTRPLNVAVYNANLTKNSFADSLRRMDIFQNVFEIPPALIEGEQYYQRKQYGWYPYYIHPPSTNIQQLRLAAAEGKADVLIYCGFSHYYREKTNPLGYSYILLVTALFVPGINIELTTEVDLFFIDVRNGLLYASYHDEITHEKNYATIYYLNKIDDIKERHVQSLIPNMIRETRYILSRPEYYID